MKVLITGGCGFIGHHLIEHIIKNTDWHIVVWDKLTYAASGFDRLRDIDCFDNKRIKIFTIDFTSPISEGVKKEVGDLDYILHIGAETHVDRSIECPMPFIMANVVGTAHMLDYARNQPSLRRFVYFSTDEVFGAAPKGVFFKEWDRYNSCNPYAATKAGGEELCLAYSNTYSVPIFITHTMNAFGERQNQEKFIPLTIRKVLLGETVIIHSDSTKTIPGSRSYIHCRNIASALLFLLEKSTLREKYNIVGEKEVNNLELAKFIAQVLGKELKYEMVDFHSSRPGHDLRYSLDGNKLKNMGWQHPKNFEESLTKTIEWYLKYKNKRWLRL
ncbi:NAD-dependent epimerase [Euryarchaeota archaeon SM23-78]|nr:MAG: NAD-dependent epimerase [Euryarchaeota archaeon SM23-78]